VLLVPGLGGVGSYWARNLPAFSARHQAIVHDHRGTGGSARSRISYSVDQMTDDLVAVMDHLKIAHLATRPAAPSGRRSRPSIRGGRYHLCELDQVRSVLPPRIRGASRVAYDAVLSFIARHEDR
jgi:hypothetical protein